jgi:tRNA pseudouridine32 synthase/23S rRNA pseudouridine746 synthase
MRQDFIYKPPNDPLDILYKDDDLLFVDKPSGLLSVPGRLEQHKDNLLSRLQAIDPSVLLVHRLDMDTSGVMVFARNLEAQRDLSRQFAARVVEKTYLAEVAGHLAQDSGMVDSPLMVDWPNRPLQMVSPAGKPSVTHWVVLEQRAETSVVELRPETGRSHQLRVHMAKIGHPILGDVFYAPEAVAKAAMRLHLHAAHLGCLHPTKRQVMAFGATCSFGVLG